MQTLRELLSSEEADVYAEAEVIGYRRYLSRGRVLSLPRTVTRRLDLPGNYMQTDDRDNLILLSLLPDQAHPTPNDWRLQTNSQLALPIALCRRWDLSYPEGQVEVVDLADRAALLPSGGISSLMANLLAGVKSEIRDAASEEIFATDISLIDRVAFGALLRHALVPNEPAQA